MENLIDFKNKVTRNIIIVAVAIILLLFARELVKYFKDRIIVKLGGYTTQIQKVSIDSTFVKGKIDTVAVFTHYVKTKGIVLNPKTKIVYLKDPVTKRIGDSLKEFTVSISDSLILGDFTVRNDFTGNLKSSLFNYKPLFPKYISRTDTIRVIKTVTNTLTKDRSLIGGGVGYSNLHYLSILGSYTTKKHLQVIIEYGKPLNKTIEIIQGTPLTFLTDDLYSIKLIKHF